MSRLFYTIALFLFVSKLVVSAPTCLTVVEDLAYCLGYLQGREVSPACCAGLKSLSGVAKTTEDRQSICECVKNTIARFPIDVKLMPTIPQKCGVDMTLPPIDEKYDCSKVSAY